MREVAGLADVTTVVGGLGYFLALKTDGTVWGWGHNTDGQLGNNSSVDTATPAQATGLTGVTALSAGDSHSLAVKSDGTVWGWGSNNFKQLGLPCCADELVPVQIPSISQPIAVAAGPDTSYAVLSGGTVWVWGQVPSGLVPGAPASSQSPLQVPGLSGIASIVAGATATYALGEDGRIRAWGSNQYGQLGDHTTTSRNTPALVPGLPAIRSVSASPYHALAVAADGSVWAWGRNGSGQVGDLTPGVDRLGAIAVLQPDTVAPVETETPGTLDASTDTVRYYHVDGIGSVRAVTDASGQLVERHDYKPFGDEWSAPSINRRGFAGQDRDQETLLDYFGARHYASQTARFTTVDPGHVNGDTLDPQSWNAYAYARNNPLKYIDPTGTEYEICGLDAGGRTSSCGTVSDQYFANLESSPGRGLRLWGGAIWRGEKRVGYYTQVSVDATFAAFARRTGELAAGWLREQTTQMAVEAVMAATGGLAAGAFSGGLAMNPSLSILNGPTSNALRHIFGNAAHNLEPLVARFGSQDAAFVAVRNATQVAVRARSISGVFETTVRVGGKSVVVRGNVINGIVRIGTFFIP
jgi:RHS repeat-associated protein